MNSVYLLHRRKHFRSPKIPAGLIVFCNDTTIPDGWTRFSAADNRYIIGAGNQYSAGDTGGSDRVLMQTTTTGTHSDHPIYEIDFQGSGGYGELCANAVSGAHFHSVACTHKPQREKVVLIQADVEQQKFPSSAVVLAAGAIDPLSCVLSDNSMLFASSTIGTEQEETSFACSVAGSHVHGTEEIGGFEWTGYEETSDNGGEHYHSISYYNITVAIKRKALRALSDNTEFLLSAGVIGMWESLTPPDGWRLCDGLEGTVDLRDYFVEIRSDGAGDLIGSENSIDIYTDLSPNSFYHSHMGDAGGGPGTWNDEIYWKSVSHTHSASINTAMIQPYYALSFIQKM